VLPRNRTITPSNPPRAGAQQRHADPIERGTPDEGGGDTPWTPTIPADGTGAVAPTAPPAPSWTRPGGPASSNGTWRSCGTWPPGHAPTGPDHSPNRSARHPAASLRPHGKHLRAPRSRHPPRSGRRRRPHQHRQRRPRLEPAHRCGRM